MLKETRWRKTWCWFASALDVWQEAQNNGRRRREDCRGEWGKMPRWVRCPIPSPGETGGGGIPGCTYFLCKASVPPAQHTQIHFCHVFCEKVIGVSFICPDFYDELTSVGYDYSSVYFLLLYMIKLSIWAIHFVTFLCMLRVFFGYANETSRRYLGERSSFGGERRP